MPNQPRVQPMNKPAVNNADILGPPASKPTRSLSMVDFFEQEKTRITINEPELTPYSRAVTNKRTHGIFNQFSMPTDLDKRRDANNTTYHHSRLDERIINCQLSIASKKDFSEEVRALIDVRKFVSDSFILTDITEVSISSIVEVIVDRLVECRGMSHEVAEEAKSLLFVEKGPLSMLLANTMQGLYKSRLDGRIAYDNSWIVATAVMSSLPKRQVAIARFPQPVNFGRQSHEVRFLIIVLAPNREKLTKSAWETGRTFATMFTDINFRRRLLRAKTQDDFKIELLSRAETLARENSDPFPELYDELAIAGDIYSNYDGLGPLPTKSPANGPPYGFNYAKSVIPQKIVDSESNKTSLFGSLGSGLKEDFVRRSKYYFSDFTDGFLGHRSLYKTISTTVFLYFSVLLPCIAFGVVDTNNTDGQIDPKKTMVGQALGGLFFAFFSGQPLIVIMTTAPLCIYVKVIYQISQDLEVEFSVFYACVGLWMALFLVIMSITNLSNLMKYCTRSTEDIFAIFTAFAFGSDGIKEATRSFNRYYWDPDCLAHSKVLVARTIPDSPGMLSGFLPATNGDGQDSSIIHSSSPTSSSSSSSGFMNRILPISGNNNNNNLPVSIDGSLSSLINAANRSTLIKNLSSAAASAAQIQPTYTTSPVAFDLSDNIPHHFPEHQDVLQHTNLGSSSRCQRETCILFLFLMSGTLFLANSFSSFNKTPYLSSRKREIIKDYALAISVLIFSFVGSYIFSDVRLDVFEFSELTGIHFTNLSQAPWKVVAVACPLGFMLSVLFYIDQNICGAMVNNAPYKLKKGDYFHLDLIVLAVLNSMLSIVGLPWMHGKLPHSHLHAKALADYEERVDEGHVHQSIVNIRETRLTGILVSILVGLSLYAIPYPLSYIPLPVLSGVFLYTALAEFKSNSMVERICLFFTEQAAYPPNHYIRRCPQRKIHMFTISQILQLAIVCAVGFYPNPYVNMAFPLAVALFVPLRSWLLPKLINIKYLNSLDSSSLE